MDIGALTSFFTLDILLGRGSVVVRDGLVILRILLFFLFAILIGLSESTINAGSELLVCDSLGDFFTLFSGIISGINSGFDILAGFSKSIIDSLRSVSSVSSSIITFKFSA